MAFAMQVYVELAVLENFCMDFTLLYAAKVVSKNPAGIRRLVIGSALGACFAVLFPLFKLGAVWSVVLKIISGAVICLVSGKFKSVRSCVKFCGAFLIFTALLGGALIGIFSLAGIDYSLGEGFVLSSVPVGIPMFGALILIIGARRLAAKLTKRRGGEVVCKIFSGQTHIEIKGFFDSGNKVFYKGVPVNIIPGAEAEKLLNGERINEGVKIHTVAGSKTIGVFTADKMEIDFGEKTETVFKVKIGVSPRRIDRAVLHCDLLED